MVQLAASKRFFGFILGVSRDQGPFSMGILDTATLEWVVGESNSVDMTRQLHLASRWLKEHELALYNLLE